jgi:hypothetical protein
MNSKNLASRIFHFAFIIAITTALADAFPIKHAEIVRRTDIPYQSAHTPFQEWLAQLTLCFAPLATHILTGVPTPVTPKRASPSWISRINFYNPTTILWRYLSITDRRIRCKDWTAEDMAASNSAFWILNERTREGYWDGSEEMMVRSREWLIQPPPENRVSLISVSVISTVVVVAQGIQALYEVIAQIQTGVSYIQGLSGVFLPLAIFSLTRLPPAVWLSDEFTYTVIGSTRVATAFDAIELTFAKQADMHLLIEEVHHNERDKMRSQMYPPAVLFRIAVVLLLFAFIGISVGHVLTNKQFMGDTNVAGFSQHILYTIWVIATLIIFVAYGVQGQARTTIIPCIGSRWYLAYTLLWYAGAVVVIVLNAVQMRRTTCGEYTTYLPSAGLDDKLCAMFDI